jgi:protocatechuate 3,4-dioxygenase beta subunit
MSKHVGMLVGAGAVVAAIAGALFLVMSDPAEEETAGGAPAAAEGAVEESAPEVADAPSGRRRARVPGAAAVHGIVQHAGDESPAASQAVRLVGDGVGTLEVTTDSAGAFRFEGLPPGGPYAVEVDSEGFAPIRLPGIALDRSEERDLGTLLLDLAVRIEVHVADMTDRPLEGARVLAYAAPQAGFGFDWSKAMAQMGQEPVAVATVTTGTDGVAVFDELASGSWSFVARKDGYASTGRSSLRLRSNVEPEPVRLHLATGHRLTGRVLDENDAPISGAVVMGGGGNAWDLGAAALRARATSGQDGTYELSALRAGDTPIWVAPPGATPAQIITLRIPDVPTFDIRIGKGGIVRGRVTMKESGEPVEGARVRAMTWGPLGTRTAETVTDAEGRYAIEDLPKGNLGSVTAEKEGLTQVVEQQTGFTQQSFESGVTVDKDVEMLPGAVLTGTVSGPDGPVSGARVMVMHQVTNSFSQKQATTDAEGKYRFDTLTEGKYLVQAGAPGLYVPDFPQNWWMALQIGNVPEHLSGEIVAGEEKTHDVQLERGSSITGRVESSDGRPLGGASVRASSNNGWLTGAAEPTVTGDDGTFRIEGVVPGPVVNLTATYKGMTVRQRDPINMADGNPVEGEIIVMEPLPVVRGRVTTSSGDLPDDAYVQVRASPQMNGNFVIDDPMAFGSGEDRYPVGRDGGYEVRLKIGSGNVRVHAVAPGFAPATSDAIQLEEGKLEYTQDVQLGDGLELSGRVVDDRTGQGIEGAHVRVTPTGGAGSARAMEMVAMDGALVSGWSGGGGSAVVAITDADGAFRATGLGPGNHKVQASAERYVAGSIDTQTPHSGQLSLPLAPEMEISGTVTFGDGKPVAGVLVAAAGTEASSGGPRMPGMGGGGSNATTDAEGRFVLKALKRGQYTLSVRNNWGGNANVQPFTSQPTAAGSQDVRLVVQAGLKITGRVVDDAGKPVTQVWIWGQPVNPPKGAPPANVNARANQDGTFELVGLPSNVESYDLTFNAQMMGGGYTPVTLEKVKPGTTGLEVVMESGLKIEGTILDAEGKALTNAWVTAQPVAVEGQNRPRGSGNAMLDADGSFTIGGLSAGTYKLHLQTWGQNGRSRALVLEGGDEVAAGSSGLRLTAVEGATISGTVVDESGQGVANANVSARPAEGGRSQSARTAQDGTFEIGGLADGSSYTLQARAAGKIGSQIENVTPGTNGLRLEVRAGVTTEGVVLLADGSPLASGWIYLQPVDRPDLTQQNARTDAEGRFTVNGTDEGATYKVRGRIRKDGTWTNLELGTVQGGQTGVELQAGE